MAPHDEVPEILPGNQVLESIMAIDEGNGFPVGDEESPVDAVAGLGCGGTW
jgi:hypothetical protein